MKALIRKIPSAVVAYLWTLAIANAFLASTTLSKTNYLNIYFAIVIGLMTLIRYRLILYPLVLFFTAQVVSFVFNKGAWFSLGWAKLFYKKIAQETGFGFMSNELAMLLFIAFILLNLILILRRKKWKGSVFMVSLYLLALIGIDQSYIQKEVIVFILASFALAYDLNLQNDGLPIRIVPTISVALILALLMVNAQGFPSNFKGFHTGIQEYTRSIRTDLREKGFYEIQKIGRDNGLLGVVGFSEQDNSLGGPIAKNSSTVFEVRQRYPHNWRIETKEIYTGTGWQSALGSGEPITLPLSVVSDGTQYLSDTEEIIFVNSKEGMTYLPIPLMKTRVIGLDDYQITNARYEVTSQRIRMNGLQRNELRNVKYEVNEFELSLEAVMTKDSISDPRNDIDYLQLPDNLPPTIEALALAIVGDETNDYLKAKKIEAYFNRINGTKEVDDRPFTYSLAGAEYTPADRDFVDYFLSDTRIGYCEHYSSAMVVMLRSLGIHTRWVKGYAAGRIVEQGNDGIPTYRITSDEAHAWPEVYFEDIGWLAFEPTPGFDNLQEPSAPETVDPETSNTERPNETEPKTPVKEEHLPQGETTPQTNPSGSIKINTTRILRNVLIFVGLVSLVLYYFRKRIRLMVFLHRLKSTKPVQFTSAFTELMHALNQLLYREPSESIREYCARVRRDLNCDFEDLRTRYEAIVYGAVIDETISPKERERFLELGNFIKEKQK